MKSTELSNAIRFLSIDAVERAKSGHPGAPMGMADIAYVLWKKFLKHNPSNPNWLNRDRFVLSNGHGSMLLYSLLHLTGYNVTINDIKNFRIRGSSGKVNLALDGLPDFKCLPGDGHHLRGAISISPSYDHLENAYDDAKYGNFSQKPFITKFNDGWKY